MSVHEDAATFGITSAEIAWPIVLAICIALMVFPFAFIIIVKRGSDSDDTSETDAP